MGGPAGGESGTYPAVLEMSTAVPKRPTPRLVEDTQKWEVTGVFEHNDLVKKTYPLLKVVEK